MPIKWLSQLLHWLRTWRHRKNNTLMTFDSFEDDLKIKTKEDILNLKSLHFNVDQGDMVFYQFNTTNREVLPSLSVPYSIGQCHNLTCLNLSNCSIHELPWSIIYLRVLKILDLSFNYFQVLPSILSSLSNLEDLNLESNRLVALQRSIVFLPKLKYLHIENNNELISPPYNICVKGISSMQQFLDEKVQKKNLWENSHAYYTDEQNSLPFYTQVQPLIVLCVNIVIKSKQDYIHMNHVPPRLKTYLQTREKEAKLSIKVAKCGDCGGCFSNEYYFDAHICRG